MGETKANCDTVSSGDNKELKLRYEKYKGVLNELTLMSDMFMRNVFKKPECTEYVLQIVMGRKELKVLEQVIQKDYKNLQGRSAILDCVAIDGEGNQFDVEIQQDREGASPKRARYHSGLMDMNTLEQGQDFDELPETHVIFITRDDVLGEELPIYHVVRKIQETGREFGDGSHIIYVNSRRQDDTELGRLMRDFHCKRAEDMCSTVLSERVRELKETQEGVDVMCREMEKIYSEGEQSGIKLGEKIGERIGEERGRIEGIEVGEEQAKREMSLSLSRMGLSVEKIAEAARVSVKQVQEWLTGSVA